ncbi:type II CRISPR RNA-guided endonuclease Cas9 [Lentibacillus saliphilus]|uniref:type II CRISPR RNA-guided endonuclease Cas9 n=1 Tax=Lentibacillus saliphilus TaxID=2737028 RepID=UPI001C311496|nr:type II CRISPR RNA-guided endonuclease Cas9 [Lentibacillus saliphilus]
MRFSIGLDIGISSVGWTVIDLDRERIEDMGVRVFDVAENPKDGSSLAAARREARSSRKTIRRRRYRIGRVRKMIVRQGLLSEVEADQLFNRDKEDLDVWLIRIYGLERKLTNREYARILIHYAKNRGFKSNRKSDTQEEDGQLLQAVKANKDLMKIKQYRTVAEMLIHDKKFAGRKRNIDGDYSRVIARSEVEHEIHTVFEKQREFGHAFATQQNEDVYIKIWSSQRPFITQDDIERKIGYCTFEPNEKRAPKWSYTFERFCALDKLNRLKITSDRTAQRSLADGERVVILNKLMNQRHITFKELRKMLRLQEYERFDGLIYDLNKTNTQNETKVFLSLEGVYNMKQAVKSAKGTLTTKLRPIDYDTFSYALTYYKDDQDSRDYLKNTYVNEDGKKEINLANQAYDDALISELLHLSFSKFGHLSFKALNKIMPYVESGLRYEEACEKAGYQFNQRIGKTQQTLLPVIPTKDITNPVVIRAFSQMRKVLNAIIKHYGSPSFVYIELGREMGRRYPERRDLEKQYNRNRQLNDSAKETIRKLRPQNGVLRGHDILKFKLWEEQKGRCAYSNNFISVDQLFEAGYAEVDHIIPYSRSFDDSTANKVLVLAEENQNKGQKTPYEWFGSDAQKWDAYTTYVHTLKVHKKKKNLLLNKHFDQGETERFKARNINDSRYITCFLKGFIEDNLRFNGKSDENQHVYAVNGAYTALMRKRWGFNKNRQADERLHAVDAAIVAVSLPFRDTVEQYFKRSEAHTSQPLKCEIEDGHFPEPWEGFKRELEARMIQDSGQLRFALESLAKNSYDQNFIDSVKPIIVSRMPKRSIKGKIHEETLRRHRDYNDRGLMRIVTKTRLENIPFDKKTGDFPMYGKESDPKTYEAIKKRYLAYDGKKEQAFKTPLYKPSKRKDMAPIIRSVKIEDTTNRAFVIDEHTVAANGRIARTEVFRHKKTGKYYLTPVYVSEVLSGVVPSKLITQGKPYKDWAVITDDYEFQFNLFQNDVLNIKLPREKTAKTHTNTRVSWEEGLFYFNGVDTATAQIKITDHKNSFQDRIGITGLKVFDKYQIDPLGNLSKVNKEIRRDG